MKKLLALCSLAFTLALPLSASAQEDYPPGEVRLAPTIDLDLQSVPIEGMPGRTLNLPPGFKVKLFSDQVNKARFMAFDDNGVLHLTNMHTNGTNQWSPDPNRTSDVLGFKLF